MNYEEKMRNTFKFGTMSCILCTVLTSLVGVCFMLADNGLYFACITIILVCVVYAFKKVAYGVSKEEKRIFYEAYTSKTDTDWQAMCLMYGFTPVIKGLSDIVSLVAIIITGAYRFSRYCTELPYLNSVLLIPFIQLLTFELLLFILFISIWITIQHYGNFRELVLRILN